MAVGGIRLCDLVFKQTISNKLGTIRDNIDAQPNNLIEEIFPSLSDDMIKQVKGFFRDTKNIPVELNFPKRDISLPWIGVLNPTEREDDKLRSVGDFETFEHVGNQWREQRGIGLSRNTQVWICTQDPQTTTFLYWVVWLILFSNKLQMDEYYQIQNMSLSGGDMKYESEFLPAQSYSKMISIQHQTRFDYQLSPVNSVIIQLQVDVDTPQVDSTGVTVQNTVVVPSEEDE